MDRRQFQEIERYMLKCMKDSAHDRDHIYRVLYAALDIASYEQGVDQEVLIAACLLHDIGREVQYQDSKKNHAKIGSKMACRFLMKKGWPEEKAEHVRKCIVSHRYRTKKQPETLEAKILFDADKLDATGATGMARTLFYCGQTGEPLYSMDAGGNILDGTYDKKVSFFQEYKFKLETLYAIFYTKRGKELALERQQASEAFYKNMLREVRECCRNGQESLSRALGENLAD